MNLYKKGISRTITVLLIIMCVIVVFNILYVLVSYFMNNYEQDSKIKITTTNLELEKSLLIFERNTGKLQLNIKGELQNITMIKAVVLGSSGSGSYLIYDVPEKGNPKTYVLNVSTIGNIREILVYPVVYTTIGARTTSNILQNTKGNINQILISPTYEEKKIEYYTSSSEIEISSFQIDPDAHVINPEQQEKQDLEKINCVSDWECEEWSSCHAVYTLDNAIFNEFNLTGEQTRLCRDKNKCLDYLVDRKECKEDSYVTIRKLEQDNKQYVEIYDKDNNLVSKLEFIKGEHSVLNIDIPII
ncbi:MAG: hypothetical protein QXW97_01160 [Candidatus Pacearchaeota archaeon]